MPFFIEFLGLYWKHLSAIDVLILGLGIITLVGQFWEVASLSRSSGRVINQDLANAERKARNAIRLATLAIDGFPLLGLLGTVAALLVTFAGMQGSQISSNIISDFAPGLTSTVSGLLCSLINLAMFQLKLVPAVEELRRRGTSHG